MIFFCLDFRSTDSIILLRFVFGSSVVKINPDAITRVMHLYKILYYNNDFGNYQQSAQSWNNIFIQKYSQ